MFHCGIIVFTAVNKNTFVSALLNGNAHPPFDFFNGKSGVLFSDMAIQKFIKEEDKHQALTITRKKGRPLRTFSSGERKKALLEYYLKQKVQFLVLDNPFDHLDQKSRIELGQDLEEMARKIHLIFLVNRAGDIPDFISKIYQLEQNNKITPYIPSVNRNSQGLVQIPGHLLVQQPYRETQLVHFENVNVSYKGESVIANISFTVNQGQTWQLVGPNGSGKSTILSLITGDNPKAYGQNILML